MAADLQRRGNVARALRSVCERFSGRQDSEHEQAFVRLVIGLLLGAYFTYYLLFTTHTITREELITGGVVMVWFLASSAGLIVGIAFRPGASPARRLYGVALDAWTITYFSASAPDFAAPLYCLYLWIIFGHGFRFGRPYLYFALVLSFSGFGIVVFTMPYWQEHRGIGIGLWLGMLGVSLYIGTLVKRLTDALKAADQANIAKRRFISGVSHEMRTPLNAIIGMSSLLKSTSLDEEQADMVVTMEKASHMMLSLIEGVLDFSKIEAGKLVIENTPFLFHLHVHNTVEIFKYSARERGLKLTISIAPNVSTRFIGDPHHLRQVIVNLLGNALKFTEKGGVELRITAASQTVDATTLRMEVIDTGIGIAPHNQVRIFESFTQADDSTTRRYGGTGLGITISKQLIELMGGVIGVHSELGEGSTFWFEVTLAKDKLGITETVPAKVLPFSRRQPADDSIEGDHNNLAVLVADDNTVNQQVVKKILTRRGHSCVLVENGEQALERMMNEDFDVIVLDMNMPVLNGIETAKAYQFMTTHEMRSPIILFSADVTTEVIEEARAAGVDRFIPKPFEVGLFLDAVESLADEFAARRDGQEGNNAKTGTRDLTSAQTNGLLNHETLKQLVSLSDDKMFLQEIIIAFKSDTAITMKLLNSTLAMQNASELQDHFHSLRGAAISIGAEPMQELCKTLEHKPRKEWLEEGLINIESLKRLYAQTCVALDEYLVNYLKKINH